MPGGGNLVMPRPIPAMMTLRSARSPPESRPVPPCAHRDRYGQLAGPGTAHSDLAGEAVDLVRQDRGDPVMVVVRPAGQRLGQPGPLGVQPAPRQASELARVVLPPISASAMSGTGVV